MKLDDGERRSLTGRGSERKWGVRPVTLCTHTHGLHLDVCGWHGASANLKQLLQ